MATGTVKIVQARWDQLEVGDTFIDYTWQYPRWQTIAAIHNENGTTYSLTNPEHAALDLPLNKWFKCFGHKIVDVQVVA